MSTRFLPRFPSNALILLTFLSLAGGVARAADGPKVVVLGFDGADARLVERWMESGDLPNLARLRDQGAYSPLLPTNPPQTPVSWSAFATGLNPGRTEIFDFLKRVEGTYLPDFAMASPTHRDVAFGADNPLYLGIGSSLALGLLAFFILKMFRVGWGKSLLAWVVVTGVVAGPLYVTFDRYVPKRQPWAENGRRGKPIWKVLQDAGKTSTILRLPVTFPADDMGGGKMLSGLGVPDMRGGIGTPTLYTTDPERNPEDNEFAIRVVLVPGDDRVTSDVLGPENLPFHRYAIDMAGEGHESRAEGRRAQAAVRESLEARGVPKTLEVPLQIAVDRAAGAVTVEVSGQTHTLRPGEWSEWVTLEFPVNWVVDRANPVRGASRFHLLSMEPLNLYLAPVNFHWDFHPVPFSYPANWASKLKDRVGPFKTLGWAIDTWTMSAGLAHEAFTLSDVAYTEDTYARMMQELLAGSDDDLYVQIFTGPDRAGHMLWRLMDPEHPLYDQAAFEEWGDSLKDVYRQMDRIVGQALEIIPDDALFIVCSDHGFSSYRRGVNYNTWLAKNGFMTLASMDYGYGDAKTLDDLFQGGTFFENVDWSRTKAYAMGLGEIYINLAGREPEGIVEPGAEYEQVRDAIIHGLESLVDPATGEKPIFKVYRREDMYPSFNASIVPDLRVANSSGYRVEWQTALGGFTPEVISENLKPWSGDHCSLDPSLVKGILFMNRPIGSSAPRMVDLAPTILEGAGVSPPAGLDGVSLLSGGSAASN